MKNIKKNIVWLMAASAAFSLAGCSDFLDEADPSNFTIDSYFKRPEHAIGSVNAIYASMRDPLGSGFGGGAWTMTEFATGLAGTDLGQAVNSYFVKDLNNTAENGYGQTYWSSYYRGIANANLSIARVQAIPGLDSAEAKMLLGEAHFLRAWYYFNLVQLFGNIPLITEVMTLESEQLRPMQAPSAEVYDLIVSDLTMAEKSELPWLREDGRVGMGAVKSLLAKVYLTMAGYPMQAGAEYYGMAAEKAKEVIDSEEFSLFESYNDLHDPAKKNVEENIFMIQFKTQIIPSSYQVLIIPYNKGISQYSDETGGIYATTDFAKSYEKGDLRAEEKQFFYSTFTSELDRSAEVPLGGYFLFKHFDFVAQTSTANSDLNWPVIRYADVLLMFAEASNEAKGPTADAYEAVNAIRSRAKLAGLKSLNKAQLREAVWRERWYELCFENISWFDMARLRKAFNVSTKKFDDFVGHKFSYGPVLSERELLFPLPASELLNNRNLIQNAGY